MSGTETLWQELICRLEGVQAAQVVFAENGMPCIFPVWVLLSSFQSPWASIQMTPMFP